VSDDSVDKNVRASGAETEILDPSEPSLIKQVASMDPLIGTTIDGKYVVERLIGEGGMGKVYRGLNTRTAGPVAIKTLIPGLLADESVVARFEIEAKSASNLQHPNTIRIYDFGREGDVLFMVMELLDGEPFDALISRVGRVDPQRTLHIMRQTCRSLAEAHAAGVVHRDMKPDNIFLNRVGDEPDHVKVLDFGVAKLKVKDPSQATLTQAGMIFGTPRYMSPEQARAYEIDGRSDIYALGVIMFESLTGKPPFDAPDPVSILVKHVQEPVPSFQSVAPDLGPMPDLEAIVRRCMEKNPDARFDDVSTLLNALEAASARLGRYATDPAFELSNETMALERAHNDTFAPPVVDAEAFDKLGISEGKAGTKYTFGADVEMPATGAHMAAEGRKKLVGVTIGAVALLAVVAGGLAAMLSTDETLPVAEPDVIPEVAVNPAMSAVAAMASGELGRAVGTAGDQAGSWVVQVSASSEVDGATVSLAGGDSRPVPFTYFVVRDPADLERRVEMVFAAPGYQERSYEVALAEAEIALAGELRRQRSNGNAERPPSDPPPERRPDAHVPEGGLDDPFQ
jgi:hypothetical protein